MMHDTSRFQMCRVVLTSSLPSSLVRHRIAFLFASLTVWQLQIHYFITLNRITLPPHLLLAASSPQYLTLTGHKEKCTTVRCSAVCNNIRAAAMENDTPLPPPRQHFPILSTGLILILLHITQSRL